MSRQASTGACATGAVLGALSGYRHQCLNSGAYEDVQGRAPVDQELGKLGPSEVFRNPRDRKDGLVSVVQVGEIMSIESRPEDVDAALGPREMETAFR